jgi:hypothetical protein
MNTYQSSVSEVPNLPTEEGREMSDCQWTATTIKNGLDTVRLTVKGVCQAPTPGYKLTLTRLNVAGSDPDTLLLVLTVVPPTGIEPDHVTRTPVEYHETFLVTIRHPSKVTIFEAAETIEIKPA